MISILLLTNIFNKLLNWVIWWEIQFIHPKIILFIFYKWNIYLIWIDNHKIRFKKSLIYFLYLEFNCIKEWIKCICPSVFILSVYLLAIENPQSFAWGLNFDLRRVNKFLGKFFQILFYNELWSLKSKLVIFIELLGIACYFDQ